MARLGQKQMSLRVPRNTNSKLYRRWWHMMQRCHDTRNKNYADYGGRGITVSEEWRVFAKYRDDMGEPPFIGAQIDRINNDLGYCKANCRWVTHAQQMRNTRGVRMVEVRGERMTLFDCAERYGVKYDTLRCRLKCGWPIERAITQAPRNGDFTRKSALKLIEAAKGE